MKGGTSSEVPPFIVVRLLSGRMASSEADPVGVALPEAASLGVTSPEGEADPEGEPEAPSPGFPEPPGAAGTSVGPQLEK